MSSPAGARGGARALPAPLPWPRAVWCGRRARGPQGGGPGASRPRQEAVPKERVRATRCANGSPWVGAAYRLPFAAVTTRCEPALDAARWSRVAAVDARDAPGLDVRGGGRRPGREWLVVAGAGLYRASRGGSLEKPVWGLPRRPPHVGVPELIHLFAPSFPPFGRKPSVFCSPGGAPSTSLGTRPRSLLFRERGPRAISHLEFCWRE